MIKIAIGSDHGGFLYKEEIIKFLKEKGFEVIDEGCFSTERANYAEFALKVAKSVASKESEFGVIICNSGEGVSIAANKVKGIRAGIGYNDDVSHLLREHNDANIITFGANFQTLDEVKKRIFIFLNSKFEGGRHLARVKTITDFENQN